MKESQNNYLFIYPKLPAVKDFLIFRIGGNGLANCLFIYAGAIIKSKETGAKIITPTWLNISIGTYLRKQNDKRHYFKVFKNETISGFRKLFILIFRKQKVLTIEGFGNYFEDLKGKNIIINQHFQLQFAGNLTSSLPKFNTNVISIHIRLGDYPIERRVPIIWYKSVVIKINELCQSKYEFNLYSDGTNEELKELLIFNNVKRNNHKDAIIDLWLMSKSILIIASDSTFSAWAAYLNQTPLIFYKRHFSTVLNNLENEIVIENNIEKCIPLLKRIL